MDFETVGTEATSCNASAYPLVSVIIANYNYGQFLGDAIKSVLNQTYRNFELIVVDDGSTDHSREVITAYQDQLISIYQENAGHGAAFNVGIQHSKGSIICLLDSDDYFYSEKVEKVVAAFQEHPEWVQISHWRTSVDQNGNPKGHHDPTTYSTGHVRDFLLQWGRYAWAITSALSYRREALEQVLPIPPRQGLDELVFADTYFTATVPFYGEVGCINEPLMFYRQHGKNYSARSINLSYLIRRRELTADYINATAKQLGLTQRFNLDRDTDYYSLKVLQSGQAAWEASFRIIELTLREGIAIRYDAQQILEALLRRCICVCSPNQAKIYLSLGPRRYLQFKLFGKAVHQSEMSKPV